MSTGTKMALAAAGGVVAGAGAAYLYSRWNSYGHCSSGNYHGSCEDCYRSHGGRCSPDRLSENANRDDLMDTGFWPDDFSSPLTVTITAIIGPDFNPSSICPPALGWNTSEGQDIFMTLTKVAGLADKLKKDGGVGASPTAGSVFGPLLLLCCCGAAAGLLIKCCMAKSQQYHDEEDPQPAFGGQQPPPVVPPQYGPNCGLEPCGPPQPQFGQPPYGQPHFGQAPVASVMMGQPMGPQQQVVMGAIVQPGQPGAFQPGSYQPGAYQPGRF